MSAEPQAAIVHPAGTTWVLVKGWHDSGTLEGVFGPYSQDHAEWLLKEMLDNSTNNWTLMQLATGP